MNEIDKKNLRVTLGLFINKASELEVKYKLPNKTLYSFLKGDRDIPKKHIDTVKQIRKDLLSAMDVASNELTSAEVGSKESPNTETAGFIILDKEPNGIIVNKEHSIYATPEGLFWFKQYKDGKFVIYAGIKTLNEAVVLKNRVKKQD